MLSLLILLATIAIAIAYCRHAAAQDERGA